jgi:intracellular septation protein
MTEPTPQPTTKPANSPWVRLVSDLGPALVFFFSYGHANKNGVPDWAIALAGDKPVLFATLVFLPAAVLGFAFSYWRERSISPIGLFSFVMIGVFSGALHMPEPQWQALATRAGLMYISLSIINEAVWRTQTEKTWVTYNTWGDMAINMIFWIVNMVFLSKFFTDADGKPLVDGEK